MSGVYEIRNVLNGRRYVGSTANIQKRWGQHRCDLRGGRHHCRFLQRDWNKRGEASFAFSVLEQITDQVRLLAAEQRWIDELSPEYNTAPVAGPPMAGRKHSQETRARMSAKRRGRVMPRELIEKIAAIGRSDAGRAKNSAAIKAYFQKPGSRKKLSEARGGRPVVGVCLETGLVVRADFAQALKGQGFDPAKVRLCVRGARRTHKGFRWSYE